MAIAFFDISVEAEAQQARARAEDRLREVVAHAPVVLAAIDRAGAITLVEGRGLESLGAIPEGVLGKSIFDAVPETPSIAEGARRALAGDPNFFVAEIGSVVYEAHLEPLRDPAGESSARSPSPRTLPTGTACKRNSRVPNVLRPSGCWPRAWRMK